MQPAGPADRPPGGLAGRLGRCAAAAGGCGADLAGGHPVAARAARAAARLHPSPPRRAAAAPPAVARGRRVRGGRAGATAAGAAAPPRASLPVAAGGARPRRPVRRRHGGGGTRSPAALPRPPPPPRAPSRPARRRFRRAILWLEAWLESNAFLLSTTVVFAFLNVAVFYSASTPEWRRRAGGPVATQWLFATSRGSAAVLTLNAAVTILLAARSLLTALRGTVLNLFLPLDAAMPTFHAVVGAASVAAAAVHTGAHFARFAATGAVEWRGGLNGTTSLFVTGVGLVAVLGGLAVVATPRLRQRHYERFYFVHVGLATLFFPLLFLHGVHRGVHVTYRYVGPAVLVYLADKAFRHHRTVRATVTVRPGNVGAVPGARGALRLRLPRLFPYTAGQYARICVPAISRTQWHPFTIASAPHEADMTFYIAESGDWTAALGRLLKGGGGDGGDGRDGGDGGDGDGRNAADDGGEAGGRGVDVRVRGPYGAPAQHWGQFEQIILIGGGVGATPFVAITKDIHHRLKAVEAHARTCAETAKAGLPPWFSAPPRGTAAAAGGGWGGPRWARDVTVPADSSEEESGSSADGLAPISRRKAGGAAASGGGASNADGGAHASDGTLQRLFDDTPPLSTSYIKVVGGGAAATAASATATASAAAAAASSSTADVGNVRSIAALLAASAADQSVDALHGGGGGALRRLRRRDDRRVGPARRGGGVTRRGDALVSVHSAAGSSGSSGSSSGSSRGGAGAVGGRAPAKVPALQLPTDASDDGAGDRPLDGGSVGIDTASVDSSGSDGEGDEDDVDDATDGRHSRPLRVVALQVLHSVLASMLLVWTVAIRYTLVAMALVLGGLDPATTGTGLYRYAGLTVADLGLSLVSAVVLTLSVLLEAHEIGPAYFSHWGSLVDCAILLPLSWVNVVVDVLYLAGRHGASLTWWWILNLALLWPALFAAYSFRLHRVIGSRVSLAERASSAGEAATRRVDFLWTAKTPADDSWLVSELLPLTMDEDKPLSSPLSTPATSVANASFRRGRSGSSGSWAQTWGGAKAPAGGSSVGAPQTPLAAAAATAAAPGAAAAAAAATERRARTGDGAVHLHRYLTRAPPAVEPWMADLTTVPLRTNYGRPDWARLFCDMADRTPSGSTVGIFFCGPPPMAAAVARAAAAAMRRSMAAGLCAGVLSAGALHGNGISSNLVLGRPCDGDGGCGGATVPDPSAASTAACVRVATGGGGTAAAAESAGEGRTAGGALARGSGSWRRWAWAPAPADGGGVPPPPSAAAAAAAAAHRAAAVVRQADADAAAAAAVAYGLNVRFCFRKEKFG
ncbi:hypothetical protein BU14_0641s0001 [Porphyra umbilicalis]|uniref:FAD-binding FR-type domain-containing protein n=1 Tax=Porphyra umbilicalis TaxID=2786 RepID=A0A1X6NQK8_PORUM|nr:hypothetical protein BU14_0641s0001 [Porphyra umbilicalis]|eukprot:OSX70888.1 hypothetical protein BU14_0641s0001 [Porphyra umbilicalis]